MELKSKNYILIIVFIILGIALAMQFKSTLNNRNEIAANTLNVEKLKSQLAQETAETETLKEEIDKNLILKENFIKTYIAQVKQDNFTTDWVSAGLTDVKGAGIIIKLDDAPARQPDTPLNWLIIHDQDIKIILNELKKSGAQAISINGERIVPMSEQVCAGPTIMINGNRYSVPYVIKAIGDPELMYENISKSTRVAEMVDYKIRVEITKSNEIVIPKFSGADNLDGFISGLEEVK